MEYTLFETGLKPNISGTSKKVDVSIDKKLEVYEQMMLENTVFETKFSRSNRETGDLFQDEVTSNGSITIQMIHDESVTQSNRKMRLAGKLLLTYQVVVISVDKDRAIVNVSHKKAMKICRKQLNDKIKEELKREGRNPEIERIIVPAKVIRIDSSMNAAFLDICGYGLSGFIPGSLIKHLGARNISNHVKVGEVMDVEILHPKYFGGDNGGYSYCCSRLNIIPNPWIGIEERYHVKDIVKIRCVEKKQKHWFGEIEGLEGIQVYCEYPDASNRVTNVLILAGGLYQGYIYAVSEERKLLKARVFKDITTTN